MSRPLGPATREAYGQELLALGRERPEIVVLDGDLSKSTMTKHFAEAFPERFFNAGIAEADMVGLAAGLARWGKLPFVSSFAAFLMSKAFDQMRISVAYAGLPVKFVGSHGGISLGEDGVSQMSVEDVALARALPGFAVFVPADAEETRRAVRAAADWPGPAFVRVGRPKAPVVYEGGCPFQPGRALRIREGRDVTLAANGLMLAAALDAADRLASEGVSARVLDLCSVKPLDEDEVVRAARETGAIVVAEEHLLAGGLGSAVAMAVAAEEPVPMAFVGLADTFAESGRPEELMQKYGLTAERIAAEARRLLRRRARA
ncbi:MAG: transketolase family protein [Clostridia bacterium]|nr:transketolase family protein [Clostridia bacterium]